MLANLFDVVFGCWHKRYSFPISARGMHPVPDAARQTGMYVVCLDCGKEFPYDWQSMKVLPPMAEGQAQRVPAKAAEDLGRAA